jgi:hypothetical protein
MWVRDLNTKRPDFGAFSHLFPDVLNDPDKFFGFFRITTESLKKLADLTGIAVTEMDTNYRRSIRVEERTAIFLRYKFEFICNINIDSLL